MTKTQTVGIHFIILICLNLIVSVRLVPYYNLVNILYELGYNEVLYEYGEYWKYLLAILIALVLLVPLYLYLIGKISSVLYYSLLTVYGIFSIPFYSIKLGAPLE